MNRENPGRLKGWRVVVKVWNSHCMCGVWSSRTMEILWVGWAQLRLQACDFCTPAYLHGCTTASQPPAARTVKMAWIPGWSFAWEALSMDWKCRRIETDSDKGVSVIVHVVLFHFWVYTLLMRVKKESEKADLKLNIQKAKIMASGPITSWQIDRETLKTVTDYIFLGSKINCRW